MYHISNLKIFLINRNHSFNFQHLRYGFEIYFNQIVLVCTNFTNICYEQSELTFFFFSFFLFFYYKYLYNINLVALK